MEKDTVQVKGKRRGLLLTCTRAHVGQHSVPSGPGSGSPTHGPRHCFLTFVFKGLSQVQGDRDSLQMKRKSQEPGNGEKEMSPGEKHPRQGRSTEESGWCGAAEAVSLQDWISASTQMHQSRANSYQHFPGARHWSREMLWPPSPPTRQCRASHVAVEEAEAHGAQGACPGRSPGKRQCQGWFPRRHTPPESTALCPQYSWGASPVTGLNENPKTLGNSSKKRKNQDNMPQPSPCPTPLPRIHPKNQSGVENRHLHNSISSVIHN